MIHEWQVKRTGKVLFLFYYYSIVFFMYLLFSIRATIKYGGTIKENLLEGLLLFSLFLLVALTTLPVWILRKKVPKYISIDRISNKFTIKRKKHSATFSLDDLAYEIKRKSFYSVLIFYRKYKATRGHLIYNKTISIVAPVISNSWKVKTLDEIVVQLKKTNIEIHTKKNNLNFLDNLLEK